MILSHAPVGLSGLLLGFLAARYDVKMSQPLQTSSDGQGGVSAMLLARCAQGDAKAFRQLYDTTAPRMYAVAFRILRNTALASDAVHDAMLQVWRNSARYDAARGNADGWLVSLVRYRALDICRRQGRELTGVDLPERADDGPDALDFLVADAEGAALQACLEQIEPPRRKLVLLAFVEGLTQTEVAARVGQPLGTVKSTIRRALLALRACLEDGPGTAKSR